MYYDLIYLAPNEWGNETMAKVAREWFTAHPACAFVEVHEHGGWWLGYRRDGTIWSTANDVAILEVPRPKPTRWSGVEVRRGATHLLSSPVLRAPTEAPSPQGCP